MTGAEPMEGQEDRGIEVARVNPVGILELPSAGGAARRPMARRVRVAALVILALFVFVTLATTVTSLGAYCLTTDGGDLRDLPNAARH
jgi:hypothetical protein